MLVLSTWTLTGIGVPSSFLAWMLELSLSYCPKMMVGKVNGKSDVYRSMRFPSTIFSETLWSMPRISYLASAEISSRGSRCCR
ncbi:MAG: hypothetical protein JRF63_13800, partial [Deltaproteobacteria bacterium]|nr:hypothetical protein [Deltaproteobacteria bacterium]